MIKTFIRWWNNIFTIPLCQEAWSTEKFHPLNPNSMSLEDLISRIGNIQTCINSEVSVSLSVDVIAGGSESIAFTLHTKSNVYYINAVSRAHDGGWVGGLLLKEPTNITLGSGALCLDTWTTILGSIVGYEAVNIEDKS